MADRKKKAVAKAAKRVPNEKPVALTVKIDAQTYLRLSTLRAIQRRTHQDILNDALGRYLDAMNV